jgi:VCBS repeat-containing protein
MTKPALSKQFYTLTEDEGSISGNALATGFDADGDPLTVAGIDGQHVGTGPKEQTVFNGDYGVLTIFENGSYTYKLNAGLNLKNGDVLVEDFGIKITDGTGYAASTLKFTIYGTSNDAPIAKDDSYGTNSSLVAGNVLANDTDPDGDILHVGLVTFAGQTVHITSGQSTTIVGVYGDLTIGTDGSFSYTATASGVIDDSFSYKAHDGQNDEGNNTDFAIVTLHLNEVTPI